MTALLLLDDPLQTYKEPQLAFLKALANRLPRHVSLRAWHTEAGKVLNYDLEIRIGQSVTFNADQVGASQDTVITQVLHNLHGRAQEAVDALALQGNAGRRGCKTCGGALIPRPGKRRHETLCIVCEDGKVDDVSQNFIDRAKRGERPRTW